MANPGRFGRYDGWYLEAISNDPCKVSMRNVTSMTYHSCCIQFLQPISTITILNSQLCGWRKVVCNIASADIEPSHVPPEHADITRGIT